MSEISTDIGSLESLHEKSNKLLSYARRLQEEFTELRETSKELRGKSIQLREDVRILRRSFVTIVK